MRALFTAFFTGLLMASSLLLISAPAWAYKDGTYVCKNVEGLPDNVYKIKTITLIEGGIQLPYLELTRFVRKSITEPNSPVIEVHNRGFATVATTPDKEILYLGTIRFEFADGKMLSCK